MQKVKGTTYRAAMAIAIFSTWFSLLPAHAATSGPVVTAAEAVVIDGWTGSVLYGKHDNSLRAPASTVKIMTAFLVLEQHLPLRRIVTVSGTAAGYGGSRAGLFAGERITIWDLLHGMLLPSGNDAAIALSEAVAGTSSRFVTLMNREAVHLHLRHTHYMTPNGYDVPNQVTSAVDLARLTQVALHNGMFAELVQTRYWTAVSSDHVYIHHWTNLNRLLWVSKHVNGVKTGTTPAAGACLVSSAKEKGKWVIAVNLGSVPAARFADGVALLDYGLRIASSGIAA